MLKRIQLPNWKNPSQVQKIFLNMILPHLPRVAPLLNLWQQYKIHQTSTNPQQLKKWNACWASILTAQWAVDYYFVDHSRKCRQQFLRVNARNRGAQHDEHLSLALNWNNRCSLSETLLRQKIFGPDECPTGRKGPQHRVFSMARHPDVVKWTKTRKMTLAMSKSKYKVGRQLCNIPCSIRMLLQVLYDIP